MKGIITLYFLLFSFCQLQSQVFHGMSFLYDANSLTQSNPAALNNENRFTIYLPEVYLGYSNSGPTFSQLFSKNEAGKFIFDKEQAINKSDNNNTIQANGFVQTFGLAYKLKKFSFSLGHGFKNIVSARYSKSLLQLYADGNAQFIGQQINIGPTLLIQNYHQYSAGISYLVDNYNVGIRLKYLSGIQDLSTKSSQIKLTTDDDFYQLQFDNNLVVNSSSMLDYMDVNNASFNIDPNILKRPFGPNHGFSVDVGVEVEIEQMLLSAAIYDLGGIRWSRLARNYTSNEAFEYNGVDIIDLLNNDNYNLSDTINDILLIEESKNKYWTSTPTQIELGIKYFYSDEISFNGNLNLIIVQNKPFITIAAAGHYHIMEMLKVSASISYLSSNKLAIGMGSNLKIENINLFIYTNNIFGLIHPADRSFSNLHFGSTLSF